MWMNIISWMFICGFFGLVICLCLMLPFAISEPDSREQKILGVIFFTLSTTAIVCVVAAMIAFAYDSFKDTEVLKTRLGTGKVIRLDNSGTKHSVTTHTTVRLNGVDYHCYGYVPDAKEVVVVETKRTYSGKRSYHCELPD